MIKFNDIFDADDCGPACLLMLARYFGKKHSLDSLREKCGGNYNGASLHNISVGAQAIGFEALALKISFQTLVKDASLPCIVYWKKRFFIVVKKIKINGNTATIHAYNPATGDIKYSEEKFLEGWISSKEKNEEKGIVLCVNPTQKFNAICDDKKRIGKKIRDALSFLFGLFRPPFSVRPATDRKLRVFITSHETGKNMSGDMGLKSLYEFSSKKYELTDNAEAADMIVIYPVREPNFGIRTFKHSLLRRYPDKCFSMSIEDSPLIMNRGIYSGAKSSLMTRSRVRTGAYTLLPAALANPFVSAHKSSKQDYIKKMYLLSFVGQRSDKLREKILQITFRRADIFVQDTSDHDSFDPKSDERIQRQKNYYNVLLRSKFAICPRGFCPNSIRLFEAMKMGVAPVILSDNWLYPKGPKWEEFSIAIKEKHVRELEHVIESYEDDFMEMGRLARKAYEQYFSEAAYFDYVMDNFVEIMQCQQIPERFYLALTPLIVGSERLKYKIGIQTRQEKIEARWSMLRRGSQPRTNMVNG